MDDAFHAMFVLAGLAFSTMVCGAALTFGIASVCRWMEWAPVNTTVNIYHAAAKPLANNLTAER